MADLLDAGLLCLCKLENTAENGDMPHDVLEMITSFYFGERRIGLQRVYLARGADEQVDMVVRIADDGVRPHIGQYAILTNYDGQENPDGDQYRITLVQPTQDDDDLKVYDLTLSRLEENYDVDGSTVTEAKES